MLIVIHFFDVKIIFTTFFIVLKGVGIKSKDSEIMPEFLELKKKKNEFLLL